MTTTPTSTICIVTEQQATIWEAYDADRNEPGEVVMIGAHTTLQGARKQAQYALDHYQETEGHDGDRIEVEEKPRNACWRAKIIYDDEDESTLYTVEIVAEPLRKLDTATVEKTLLMGQDAEVGDHSAKQIAEDKRSKGSRHVHNEDEEDGDEEEREKDEENDADEEEEDDKEDGDIEEAPAKRQKR
jgi:hypothetical protein